MSTLERARLLLVDRWAVHIPAYTAYRYAFAEPFMVSGPIRSLNIGTGGGIETLRLLRKGNHVTTLDIDEPGAARTRSRARRNGFADRHVGYGGHVLDTPIQGPFDCIMMCEVLEHIERDMDVLRKLSAWLVPGGRLILSTPTASYGQLPGDVLVVTEDIEHHVRVGYDGPELDEMLQSVDLVTVRRLYNSYTLVRLQQRIERSLRTRRALTPVGAAFAVASRPFMPLMDAVLPARPLTQLTLAIKGRDA